MVKHKFFIASLVLDAILMVACNSNEPLFGEKDLLDTFYRSLGCTSEQFTDSMTLHGMKVDAVSSTGVAYISSNNKYDRVVVSTDGSKDTLNRVIFLRYLDSKSDPAEYYKQFSQAVSEYGYTNWRGYYGDPAILDTLELAVAQVDRGSAEISVQGITDRAEFLSHLNSEHLLDTNTLQYFLETFTYTHTDGSRWRGELLLYTLSYSQSGLYEGSNRTYVYHLVLELIMRRTR